MKKKIILILILFVITIQNVYAACDYSTISRLKSLVSNVNLSYNYKIVNGVAYFDVVLNNMPSEVYFIDLKTEKQYYYFNSINGEITINGYTDKGNRYKFYALTPECYGTYLGNKYYTFPVYNNNYGDEVCNDVPNFNLCKKWVDKNYSKEEFKRIVNEYKSNLKQPEEDKKQHVEYTKTLIDKLVEFYINYYYLILIFIVIVCWVIIAISKKKNSFKL